MFQNPIFSFCVAFKNLVRGHALVTVVEIGLLFFSLDVSVAVKFLCRVFEPIEYISTRPFLRAF